MGACISVARLGVLQVKIQHFAVYFIFMVLVLIETTDKTKQIQWNFNERGVEWEIFQRLNLKQNNVQ